jgi:flagellar biosynthesis protein FlhF
MKTKKYRAATMREALEQIKLDLGEEALVLDSKRIRAGSFFGLGGKEVVEVRATTDSNSKQPVRATAKARAAADESVISEDTVDQALNLTAGERADGESAVSLKNVLAAVKSAQTDLVYDKKPASQNAPARGIELSENAPRFVHKPGQSLSQSLPPASLETQPALTPSRPATTSEYERLRAELREVKFYLGALSARSMTQPAQALEPSPRKRSSARSRKTDENELFNSTFSEVYGELLATGFDSELAQCAIRKALADSKPFSNPVDAAREVLIQTLPSLVRFSEDLLAVEDETSAPQSALAFIGATGVGKTTTIAKLAARAVLRERRRVELITLDTFRIGAIEQLKSYAEIIGAGFHVARSILELNAFVSRMEGKATVLIDTVGRSPHDLADQLELADYLRASQNIRKCLVLQATMHHTDALATVKKFSLYGSDCLTITKLDETVRPGNSASTALEAALPLLYLCAGQRVPEDLDRATPETFASLILRNQTRAIPSAT